MKTNFALLCLSILICTVSCQEKESAVAATAISQKVRLVTNYGEIVLGLYDDTPQHRDNFVKLVKEGVYDSILFHRVIENFMVQAGDPESKNALQTDTLGNGDLPYTVPAEINAKRFHKRGALGAARNGNHARASSAAQFYITQGRLFNDSTLTKAQGRINKWLAENRVVNDPDNASWATILDAVQRDERVLPQDSLGLLRSRVDSLSNLNMNVTKPYTIPETHRTVYKTEGGTPHLDQNYTVFGEVLSGMNVVDSIAAVQTNSLDRPLFDVRIVKAILDE